MPPPHEPRPSAGFGRVCVFAGSSAGRDPRHAELAATLGRRLGELGIGVVYGGGSAGLMGELARAALAAGADVIGVLPAGLFPDGVTASPFVDGHTGTFTVEETTDMHQRKARFHALADAYVALPGGFGTLEELAEVVTWGQIGLHEAPVGFLDVGGFWDPFFAWVDRAVADGFVRPAVRDGLHRATDPDVLLARMAQPPAPREPKWIAP